MQMHTHSAISIIRLKYEPVAIGDFKGGGLGGTGPCTMLKNELWKILRKR